MYNQAEKKRSKGNLIPGYTYFRAKFYKKISSIVFLTLLVRYFVLHFYTKSWLRFWIFICTQIVVILIVPCERFIYRLS